MSIEGQGHFLTCLFQVLYILCLYEAQISGERLQDHWPSGYGFLFTLLGFFSFCVPFSFPFLFAVGLLLFFSFRFISRRFCFTHLLNR